MKNGSVILLVALAALLFMPESDAALSPVPGGTPDTPVPDYSGGGGGNAPSGIRRNNPGNLRPPHSWTPVGMIGESGGFAVFDTYLHGLAAMIYLLSSRYIGYGKDTIELIGYTYAPPADNNNTENWINVVSQISGYARNRVIRATAADMKPLIEGIASIENGREWGRVARQYFDLSYFIYQNQYT